MPITNSQFTPLLVVDTSYAAFITQSYNRLMNAFQSLDVAMCVYVYIGILVGFMVALGLSPLMMPAPKEPEAELKQIALLQKQLASTKTELSATKTGMLKSQEAEDNAREEVAALGNEIINIRRALESAQNNTRIFETKLKETENQLQEAIASAKQAEALATSKIMTLQLQVEAAQAKQEASAEELAHLHTQLKSTVGNSNNDPSAAPRKLVENLRANLAALTMNAESLKAELKDAQTALAESMVNEKHAVDKFAALVTDHEQTNSRLKKEHEDKAALMALYTEKCKELDTLQTRLDESLPKLMAAEEAEKRHQVTVNSLELELEQARVHASNLQKTLEAKDVEIENLTHTTSKRLVEVDELLHQANKQVTVLERVCDVKKAETRDLNLQIEKMKEELEKERQAALLAQDESTKHIQNLLNINDEKDKENQESKLTIVGLKTKVEGLRKKVIEYKDRVVDLETDLKVKERDIFDLKTKIKASSSAPISPMQPRAPPPSPAYLHFNGEGSMDTQSPLNDGHGDVEFYVEETVPTPKPPKNLSNLPETQSLPQSPDKESGLSKELAQQQGGGAGFSLWGLETFLTTVDHRTAE